MSDHELETAISKAVASNAQAMGDILQQYEPLINKASIISGVLDEDLRQQIYLNLVLAIVKFKI